MTETAPSTIPTFPCLHPFCRGVEFTTAERLHAHTRRAHDANHRCVHCGGRIARAVRLAEEWRAVGLKDVQIIGGKESPLTVVGFSPSGQWAVSPVTSLPRGAK